MNGLAFSTCKVKNAWRAKKFAPRIYLSRIAWAVLAGRRAKWNSHQQHIRLELTFTIFNGARSIDIRCCGRRSIKKFAKTLFASRLNDTISRFVNCSSCQSTFISPARFHRVCRRAKLCNYSKGDQAIFFSESSLSSGCVTRADIFGVRARMQEVLATTLWT